MSNKKKIKTNPLNKESQIKTSMVHRRNPVIFSISDMMLSSVHLKYFSNYFPNDIDVKDFFKVVFNEFIPECSRRSILELRQDRTFHYHEITSEKLQLVQNILRQYKEMGFTRNILKDFFLDEYEKDNIYQIGFKNGLRCVGELWGGETQDIFSIWFFDPHHLIYIDEKYNNKDYSNYKICALNGVGD